MLIDTAPRRALGKSSVLLLSGYVECVAGVQQQLIKYFCTPCAGMLCCGDAECGLNSKRILILLPTMSLGSNYALSLLGCEGGGEGAYNNSADVMQGFCIGCVRRFLLGMHLSAPKWLTLGFAAPTEFTSSLHIAGGHYTLWSTAASSAVAVCYFGKDHH